MSSSSNAIIIEKKKQRGIISEWIHTIFWAGLIAIVFRSFFLEPFNIPSGSMIPTLEVGDHLFVSKWDFGYSRYSFPFGSMNLWRGRIAQNNLPVAGDVVVFRKPGGTIEFVKRVVGMPGDTVQMRNGRLYINDKQVRRENPRRYIIANVSKKHRANGYVFQSGGDKMLIKGNRIFVNGVPADFNFTIEYKEPWICVQTPGECLVEEGVEWTEVLPNGRRYQIVELTDNGPLDNTGQFTVPANRYFVLGDNRDRSSDSRSDTLGAVPFDNIIGRVWIIVYSHNYYSPLLFVWDWDSKMRWNRFWLRPNDFEYTDVTAPMPEVVVQVASAQVAAAAPVVEETTVFYADDYEVMEERR